MDRSDVLTLVSETLTQDSIGAWTSTKTTRDVFCKTESVSRDEFFAAGRSGLNPEFRFTVFFGDYSDEKTVIYRGMRYGIYRTYHATTDTLELYCARKGDAVDVTSES